MKTKLWKKITIYLIILGAILLSAKIAGAETIQTYTIREAKKVGVNPNVASWIVEHESQFDPKRTGDDGQSRGLWQISSKWHPEVSDKCAYDKVCSTKWSLKQILNGKAKEWSTWKNCRRWYKTCPF